MVEGVTVDGDEDQLRQVFANLVGNALVHTPDGVAITVRVAAIGPRAVVEVHDDGPGIAPDLVPRAFERFSRADASRSRSAGGAGLGLAIVKAIVEAHGGTVGLASAAGEGTTVRIGASRARVARRRSTVSLGAPPNSELTHRELPCSGAVMALDASRGGRSTRARAIAMSSEPSRVPAGSHRVAAAAHGSQRRRAGGTQASTGASSPPGDAPGSGGIRRFVRPRVIVPIVLVIAFAVWWFGFRSDGGSSTPGRGDDTDGRDRHPRLDEPERVVGRHRRGGADR